MEKAEFELERSGPADIGRERRYGALLVFSPPLSLVAVLLLTELFMLI